MGLGWLVGGRGRSGHDPDRRSRSAAAPAGSPEQPAQGARNRMAILSSPGGQTSFPTVFADLSSLGGGRDILPRCHLVPASSSRGLPDARLNPPPRPPPACP